MAILPWTDFTRPGAWPTLISRTRTTPPDGSGCIFCDKAAQDDDDRNLIVHRGAQAFVLLNLFPYNNGHLMVAPYRHTARLADLDDAALLE